MREHGIDSVLQISRGSSSSSVRVRLSSVPVVEVTALDGAQYEMAFRSKATASFTGSASLLYICDTTSADLLHLNALIPDIRDSLGVLSRKTSPPRPQT